MTTRNSTSTASGSHTVGVARDGKSKGKGKAVDVEAILGKERERMVHERQEAVTRVLDEHDHLVRPPM